MGIPQVTMILSAHPKPVSVASAAPQCRIAPCDTPGLRWPHPAMGSARPGSPLTPSSVPEAVVLAQTGLLGIRSLGRRAQLAGRGRGEPQFLPSPSPSTPRSSKSHTARPLVPCRSPGRQPSLTYVHTALGVHHDVAAW